MDIKPQRNATDSTDFHRQMNNSIILSAKSVLIRGLLLPSSLAKRQEFSDSLH